MIEMPRFQYFSPPVWKSQQPQSGVGDLKNSWRAIFIHLEMQKLVFLLRNATRSASLYNHYENQCARSLRTGNISTSGSSYTTLGHITKDSISYSKDTLLSVFIVAVIFIARNWKQSTCLSTDKWILNMWYLYIIKYYSPVKNLNHEIFR